MEPWFLQSWCNAWQARVVFIVAVCVGIAHASMDPCQNDAWSLGGIQTVLSCVSLSAGNLFPGVNCLSPLGFFCSMSCGMCDRFGPPSCDEAEVYEQKQALAHVLSELGICTDCAAPEVWTEHVYTEIGPTAYQGLVTKTWTSKTPLDPCNVSGVTCNRCGEPTHLALGIPQLAPILKHLPPSIFRLTAMEEIQVQGWTSTLPEPTDPEANYLEAAGWHNFSRMSMLLLVNAATGDVPSLSPLPRLSYIQLTANRLFDTMNNVLGGAGTRAVTVDGGIYFTELRREPLSSLICQMPFLTFLQVSNGNWFGPMPECMNLAGLQNLALMGSNISGPIDKLLVSSQLSTVIIDGNSFSGTLPELLAQSTRLRTLSFGGNRISGELPDLSNNTALTVLNAHGNQLTRVTKVAGTSARVDLSDNLITEFPEAFMSLPGISTLDLSRNQINHWPPAGVYARGLFAPNSGAPTDCGKPPLHPAFDWPDMSQIYLSGNDFQGQDVRDVLGSFADMPRMQVVEASDCNLTMDLPMEGGQAMLAQFNAMACDLTVRAGFTGLNTLRLARNHIEAFHGGPWSLLQVLDLSGNKVSYMHPLWFGDDAQVVSQDFRGNPPLRLHLAAAPLATGCVGAGKLTANPRAYLQPAGVESYDCTTLCSEDGKSTLVDATVNTSVLCRCRPGWYGQGVECIECGKGEWCPGATLVPEQCPEHASTRGEKSAAVLDCECEPGYYRVFNPPEPLRCEACPANSTRPSSGARGIGDCIPCPTGTTSQPGSTGTTCDDCPDGTVPAGSGQGCHICSPGSYASNETKACEPCPLGQYQPDFGMAECISCSGAGNTTWRYVTESASYVVSSGSNTAADCGCEAGRRPIGSECVPCGSGEHEGLSCLGSPSPDAVTLLPGYYSDVPISVFKCWGDEDRCAGGLPGFTCRSRREGLTCVDCEEGYVDSAGGKCKECEEESAIRMVALIVVLLMCSVAFYHTIDKHSRPKQRHSEVVLTSVLSLGVTVLQQLALLSQMSVEWTDPLKSLLETFVLMNLDINVVHVDCMGRLEPIGRFILNVTMIFTFCIVMLVLHVVFVLVRYNGRFGERTSTLVCSIGGVATLFYIAVVATITGPLQCQQHPNGKWTSRSYESVICWNSGEHTGMVVISMLALLVPVGYYVHAAYTIWQYPTRVNRGDLDFVKAYNFYFIRFRPETYWFIVVQIGRNLVLALSVMIPEGPMAIFVSLIIINLSEVFTVRFLPWRSQEANSLDIILTLCVMVLYSAAFNFSPATANDAKKQMSILCTISVVVVLSLLPALCAVVIIRRCLIKRKAFDYFLCHHKAGAGAFTRMLKICIMDRPTGPLAQPKSVFVDSDDLCNLDELFHNVRDETRTLVVVKSHEMLLRPWCMGEVSTARLNKVPTVVVVMADHLPVTPEFVKTYTEHVDLGPIFEYGLTLEMVLDSLTWVDTQPPRIVMPHSLSQAVMDDLVKELHGRRLSGEVHLNWRPGQMRTEPTGICADDGNPEGVASGMVLQKYLVKLQSDGSDAFLLPQGIALPKSLKRVIFICSGGCLDSSQFIDLVAEAAGCSLIGLPVVVQDTFRIPTPERVTKLRIIQDSDRNLVQNYVMGMFKEIAVPFHAQTSSEQVLRLAATMVSARLRGSKALGIAASSMNGMSSAPSIKGVNSTRSLPSNRSLDGTGPGSQVGAQQGSSTHSAEALLTSTNQNAEGTRIAPRQQKEERWAFEA